MIGRGKKERVAAVLEKDSKRSKLQGKKGPKTDEVLMGGRKCPPEDYRKAGAAFSPNCFSCSSLRRSLKLCGLGTGEFSKTNTPFPSSTHCGCAAGVLFFAAML